MKRRISYDLYDSVMCMLSKRRRALRDERDSHKLSVYRAARQSRLLDFNESSGSADADILDDLPTLRQRSRELYRDEPVARAVVSTRRDQIVGTGLVPQSSPDVELLGITPEQGKRFAHSVERVFKQWADKSDSQGRLSFWQQQRLVLSEKDVNGETFALTPMVGNVDPRFPISRRCELIEADRVSTPNKLSDGDRLRSGIVLGKHYQPIAYWIRRNHPGDSNISSDEWKRYAARDRSGRPIILHLYDCDRPGQSRGVPIFHAAIPTIQQVGKFKTAEAIRNRMAAAIGMVIVSDADSDTDAIQENITEFKPGMVAHLAPGQDLRSFTPTSNSAQAFDSFITSAQRDVGMATGLSLGSFSRDVTGTYSSSRQESLMDRRAFTCEQKWLADRFCNPFWRLVLEEAYIHGMLDLPAGADFFGQMDAWLKVDWVGPGWDWVDPTKDAQAAQMRIDMGVDSPQKIARSRGVDFEQCAKEIEEARELMGVSAQSAPMEEDDDDGE